MWEDFGKPIIIFYSSTHRKYKTTFNMTSLLLSTQNCNGLRNKMKRQFCFSWLKQQRADFILIQEFHWSNDIENIIRKEWRGLTFFSHGSQNARGVAILIKYKCEFKISSEYKDQNGRVIII